MGATFTTSTFRGESAVASKRPMVESGQEAAELLTSTAEGLEAWKAAQMKEFRASLQAKEAELLKVLAEEWKARDQEREILLAQRADDYSKLERQLKNAIRDLAAKVRFTRTAPPPPPHLYSSHGADLYLVLPFRQSANT
jgi:hypothetical protein